MTQKKTNRIIFVDLEATCWKEGNKDKEQELIEIGWCSLYNFNYEIKNRHNILVRAENKLSEYCSELTGITDDMLKNEGIPLRDALFKFKKMVSKHSLWGSWGRWDYYFLRDLYEKHDIEFPLSENYIDFKMLSSFMNGNKKAAGLSKIMMENKNVDYENIKHRALPDAINTAKIFRHLMEKGVNEF